MKKLIFLYTLLVVLTLGLGVAYAGDSHFDSVVAQPSNGVPPDNWGLQVLNSAGQQVFAIDGNGNATIPVVRMVPLVMNAFTTVSLDDTTMYGQMGASNALAFSINASMPGVAWIAGNYTSPASVTFRVPDDYASGGSFRVLTTQSAAGGVNAMKFDVLALPGSLSPQTGQGWATRTAQAAVSLTNYQSTSPYAITLTPVTDFANLTGGRFVTFRIWRVTGTNTVYVHSIDFFYTAKQ